MELYMLRYLLPTHPQPGCCDPALPQSQAELGGCRFSAQRNIEML